MVCGGGASSPFELRRVNLAVSGHLLSLFDRIRFSETHGVLRTHQDSLCEALPYVVANVGEDDDPKRVKFWEDAPVGQ